MTLQIDPIGYCLLRQIAEAQDDVKAIIELPKDIRIGVAFTDGFARIGIRDELVHELVRHLAFIPCEGIDTQEYEAAEWTQRSVQAQAIAQQAIKLYRGMK
jgi:hypothetical protein